MYCLISIYKIWYDILKSVRGEWSSGQWVALPPQCRTYSHSPTKTGQRQRVPYTTHDSPLTEIQLLLSGLCGRWVESYSIAFIWRSGSCRPPNDWTTQENHAVIRIVVNEKAPARIWWFKSVLFYVCWVGHVGRSVHQKTRDTRAKIWYNPKPGREGFRKR